MSAHPSWHFEGMLVGQRYQVEKLLGSGGMGSVWLGRHATLGQPVAIKFIHPELTASEEAMRRFETEAKAAARVRSRHAAQVIDHGVTSSGNPYIVMEYLEGETLDQAIRQRQRLPFEEVVEIVSQAARALSQAHAAGVVHRDLKPDNILLAREKDGGRFGYTVKVVDFGIAKIVHDDNVGGVAATKTGMVLGTPLYMSPEGLTASAPVSAASDIWSLGACAFAAATGRVPFEGEAIGDVVLKVCSSPMPVPSRLNPELPKAFDAWFAKACSRDLKQRFQTADALGEALTRLNEWSQAERERVAYELRAKEEEARDLIVDPAPASRRGLLLAGGLAGAATMLGLLGYYVMSRTKEADEKARLMMESAAAVVEAQNEQKLREAERHFWATADAGVGDAGAQAGASSAAAKPKQKAR